MKYLYYTVSGLDVKIVDVTDHIDWSLFYNNPAILTITQKIGLKEQMFHNRTDVIGEFKKNLEKFVESKVDKWLEDHCHTERHTETVEGRIVYMKDEYSQEDSDEAYNTILEDLFRDSDLFVEFLESVDIRELLRELYYKKGK